MYIHLALICCIRLCDWSFHLYHHITYACYVLYLIYFCFKAVYSYDDIFCYYLKKFHFSLKVTFSYLWPGVLRQDVTYLSCEISHFCFLVIVDLWILVLCVLLLVAVISTYCSFICRLRIVLSMYRRYLQCWRVLFLLIFLTHTASHYHLLDVSSHSSSLAFLFSGLFVEDLPLFASRIFLSILRGGWHPGVYPFDVVSAL